MWIENPHQHWDEEVSEFIRNLKLKDKNTID